MSEAAAGAGGSGALKAIGLMLALAFGLVVAVPIGLVMVMAGFTATTSATSDTCVTGPKSGEVYPSNGAVRLPLQGNFTYTSPYGMRSQPVTGEYRLHAGVDLAMSPTGGSILAAKAGTVQTVTHNAPGAGNFVAVDHGRGLTTRYLHMSSISVRKGQKVQVGQKLGTEGNTTGPGGSISTGPHLHFEVIENGQPSNAADWLKKHGIDLPDVGVGTTDKAVTKEAPKKQSKTTEKKIQGPGAKAAARAKPETVDVDMGNEKAAGGKFALPAPNEQDRLHSRQTEAMPIPPNIKKLYVEAARKYGLPWELLAGIGQTETHHGRNNATSSAGALGVMQFMGPAWVDHGVDGNGDGKADIMNDADSIHSAANKLRDQGAAESPAGVKKAILAYNVSDNYLADVLYYAQQYGNGKVSVTGGGGTDDCGAVDMAANSGATSSCPATKSPAEKGLNEGARNSLRCGKEAFPWVKTMHGVGERAGVSDHGSGDAVDFMIPDYATSQGNKRGWKMAKWFQKNANKLDVSYVIFDQKIWAPDRADEGWRPMEDRGDPTQNHEDHVHLSLN